MRLLRSMELLESGEIDNCLLRLNLAEANGVACPDPTGVLKSKPSRAKRADVGTLKRAEDETALIASCLFMRVLYRGCNLNTNNL